MLAGACWVTVEVEVTVVEGESVVSVVEVVVVEMVLVVDASTRSTVEVVLKVTVVETVEIGVAAVKVVVVEAVTVLIAVFVAMTRTPQVTVEGYSAGLCVGRPSLPFFAHVLVVVAAARMSKRPLRERFWFTPETYAPRGVKPEAAGTVVVDVRNVVVVSK